MANMSRRGSIVQSISTVPFSAKQLASLGKLRKESAQVSRLMVEGNELNDSLIKEQERLIILMTSTIEQTMQLQVLADRCSEEAFKRVKEANQILKGERQASQAAHSQLPSQESEPGKPTTNQTGSKIPSTTTPSGFNETPEVETEPTSGQNSTMKMKDRQLVPPQGYSKSARGSAGIPPVDMFEAKSGLTMLKELSDKLIGVERATADNTRHDSGVTEQTEPQSSEPTRKTSCHTKLATEPVRPAPKPVRPDNVPGLPKPEV